MNGQELHKYRKVVLAVSGFLILISLLGTIDVRNLNYAGYTLGPDNVFTAVRHFLQAWLIICPGGSQKNSDRSG